MPSTTWGIWLEPGLLWSGQSRLTPDAKAYHLMGRVLDRLSRPEEAREMYRRGRDLAGL
jgi:hypothetical protein